MVSTPYRRIGRLAVIVHMPRKLSDDDQKRLENAAHTCPSTEASTPTWTHRSPSRGDEEERMKAEG